MAKIPNLDREFREMGRPRFFARNEYLVTARDPTHGFYYLLSGEVRVYKMDAQGREVEVARLGPGDFLGEAAVFASPEFFVFAQALTEVRTLYFAKEDVMGRVEKDPAVAKLFLRVLAEKCVALNRKIESLGLQTVRQRLAQFLLSRCSGSKNCIVELPMKKGDLARTLDTVQETLSRTLKQMSEEGLIEVRGGRIRIKDCSSLRRELDGR